MTIVSSARSVTGGVDTHLDVHVAAVVDANGGVVAVESFPATPAGHTALYAWLISFGVVDRVGVEGTGAYGAGLARHLARHGLVVIEADRPNRQERRRNGKATSWTRSRPPAGRCRVASAGSPSPGPATSKRCVRCWWRNARHARCESAPWFGCGI